MKFKTLLITTCLFISAYCQAKTTATLHTSLGNIVILLNEEKAPATTANFRRYVEEGFYNGTVFHRVINGFMIQGGGFDAVLTQKDTHGPIANESHNGLKNTRASIAMARTNDPHSATSQFFINLVDNPFLDQQAGKHGYAVFGEVIEGMAVVDKIAALPTGAKAPFSQDVPQPLVIIQSVSLEETQ